MHKTLLAALPLTLLALAMPSAAQARGKSTSYRATIVPVAGDAATAAKRGGDTRRHFGGERRRSSRARGVHGQARLTDGARRDRVRLTVRGLARGERYTWSLRVAADGGDACAGEVVGAFSYRELRRGRPHASSRSGAFALEAGAAYAVVVTNGDGADVACGEFRGKAAGRRGDDSASGQQDVVEDDGALEDEDPSADDLDEDLGEDDER